MITESPACQRPLSAPMRRLRNDIRPLTRNRRNRRESSLRIRPLPAGATVAMSKLRSVRQRDGTAEGPAGHPRPCPHKYFLYAGVRLGRAAKEHGGRNPASGQAETTAPGFASPDPTRPKRRDSTHPEHRADDGSVFYLPRFLYLRLSETQTKRNAMNRTALFPGDRKSVV